MVASTWTVMVVFLPLLLIKGQAGQMYTQFALVVIFSLAVSLLDATTVVPMLATRLVRGEAHTEDMSSGANHKSVLMRMFHRFGEWLTALDQLLQKRPAMGHPPSMDRPSRPRSGSLSRASC